MQETQFTIQAHTRIANDVYRMVLAGDTAAITAPGQFINIRLDGCFLRRPISVCDWRDGEVTIIYKVVGRGTQQMSMLAPGAALDALTGLGNGYNMEKSGARPLLIGGGVGVPPLYGLCRRLIAAGKAPTVVLGFNTQGDMFYESEFRALGAAVHIATADGSCGHRGFVTDVMQPLDYTYFYACGPMPMFRAVEAIARTSGQYSFEERMGCGFGACMGCSCKTKYGSKRICVDGPVLEREEIVW